VTAKNITNIKKGHFGEMAAMARRAMTGVILVHSFDIFRVFLKGEQ